MTNFHWRPASFRSKYGVAISSFSSQTIPHALALEIGETVHILEEFTPEEGKTSTWYRGCTFNNKNKKGIFPCSFVHIKECTVENDGPFETVTPVEDVIIKELTFVLREWNSRWKLLFVNRHMSMYQTIRLVMGQLAKMRSCLVSDTLTKEQALEMKHQVVTMIDWGNGNLGMDLVPRVDYQQTDAEEVSVVEMYRIHQRSVENCQGAWPGGKVTVKNRDVQGEIIHHILIQIRSLACSIGDNSEVLISLYDNVEGRFLSEKYAVYFNKDGVREGSDSENDAVSLFTDLSLEDTQKELYLVIQILRRGRLQLEGNFKKIPIYQYRRPWGISVLCLRDLFQIKPESCIDYKMRVQYVDNDSQFSFLHEQLIKKQTHLIGRGGATDKQSQEMTISVKLLNGDLKYVKNENPLLFSKGLVITQRIGFSDFINPGEGRNDLYLTLVGAEFDRGNKTASKNVEVEVEVYNEVYERIPFCISYANGIDVTSSYYSYVLYHNNSPRWNETIRLSIPVDTFSISHIRLKLCHCSNRDKAERKLYGFSFLPVTTKDHVTRHDHKYDLAIYKCDNMSKIKKYLHLPSLRDDFNDPAIMPTVPATIPFAHSGKEYFTVETHLCSTKFAQKSELLAVLQWNSEPASKIPDSLEKLLSLRGQDIVRYLEDILDALFHMFSTEENKEYNMNIFQALTYIFNLLQEDMFEKFSCIKEDYLEKSFSYPMAHKNLMKCLKTKIIQIYSCIDFDEKNDSKEVFKVLEDILKFSVKSHILSQRIYNKEQLVKEFQDNLNEVFDAFGKVLSSSERCLNKAQAQLLNNFHKLFMVLMQILPSDTLTRLIVFILRKISKERGSTVLRGKTTFIQNTINSTLFQDSQSRSMLLPDILAHLKTCFIHKRHLELSVDTFGDLLSFFFLLKQKNEDVSEEIMKIVTGLFDVTVMLLSGLWDTMDEQKRGLGSLLISCLMEMLRLMDVKHYQKLMNDYPKPDNNLKDFLNRVLMVFQKLVASDVFPLDWTSMRMITNNVMLTSIQYIAGDLADNFLKGNDFDMELWINFFLLAVDFITQPALQLEKYSEAKRGQIKDKYCDMRVPVGCQICSLWNQLGLNNQQLTMHLVGPFLKVSMVPENELRQATIPIFFNIIQTEFQSHKDLKRIEGKMSYELDCLVLEHHGDSDFKELFAKLLLEKIQTEPEMQEEGKRFVFSVTDLLERLLDYRAIMDREEQRDTKMHCTFNILNFYKDSRKDMYIRYISRLYELHYSANNFVEAGLTLKLYAQLLTWSDRILPAEMSYPAQMETERKEALLTSTINCFDEGKAWEYGIPLCKELAEHFENMFEYKKLGEILQKQASFLNKILEGYKLRQDPSYYRVAYFGTSFPPYLKNKAFVYRGDECLKLATIMNQLMTEYPSATILTSNSPLDESYKQGDAQYIQIVSVKAVPSQRPEYAGKDVPLEISSFYACNEVDTFQFDRPFYRDDKDKNNEFKSLCLERAIIRTSYKLPGILRWYEVVSTDMVILCPVEAAIETIKLMNQEIKNSIYNAQASPEQHLRHLTMRLQGTISANVSGGIPKYQEAFFNEDYKAKYPAEIVHIEELKAVILEQLHGLEKGLIIHGKYVSQEIQPLHKTLFETFIKIKSSMGYQNTTLVAKQRSSIISTSSSSQRPSTPSSITYSSGSNRSSTVSANEVTADLDDGNYTDVNECVPNEQRAGSFPNLSVTDEERPPLPPRKNSVSSEHSFSMSPPALPNRMNRGQSQITSAPKIPVSLPKRTPPIKEDDMAAPSHPPLPPKDPCSTSSPLTPSPTARSMPTNSPLEYSMPPLLPKKRSSSITTPINVTGGSQRGITNLSIIPNTVNEDENERSSYLIPPPPSPSLQSTQGPPSSLNSTSDSASTPLASLQSRQGPSSTPPPSVQPRQGRSSSLTPSVQPRQGRSSSPSPSAQPRQGPSFTPSPTLRPKPTIPLKGTSHASTNGGGQPEENTHRTISALTPPRNLPITRSASPGKADQPPPIPKRTTPIPPRNKDN